MRILISVAVTSLLFVADLCHAQTTTVFLVRHAEKTDGGRDPDLSDAGRKRARDLARVLRSAKLDACISTQFKRTQQTAAPVAASANIKVTTHKAGQERALVKNIQDKFIGKRILLVGHSNTVPQLIKMLGGKDVPTIAESHYDNLFVLHMTRNGTSTTTTTTHMHFGAPDSSE